MEEEEEKDTQASTPQSDAIWGTQTDLPLFLPDPDPPRAPRGLERPVTKREDAKVSLTISSDAHRYVPSRAKKCSHTASARASPKADPTKKPFEIGCSGQAGSRRPLERA